MFAYESTLHESLCFFFSVIFGKINAKHEYNVYDTLPVCVGTMKLINSLSSSLTFVTEYAVSRVNYADEKLTHRFKDLPLTYNLSVHSDRK